MRGTLDRPGDTTPAAGLPARAPHLAILALILGLAASLRYPGLDRGLRHRPFGDESSFVEKVALMITNGDLDHRFYEYPGLFPYMLYPVQALGSPEDPGGPLAYLAARFLVATFSVASVAVVFLLGTRLAGPVAGLVAALLIAVSPVETRVAHEIRPDVALETFMLSCLIALDRLGGRRAELLAGAALGAATAVKFTGAFLAPAYLCARLLRPRPHLRRILAAGAVAAGVVVACTPYAIIHAQKYLLGVRHQLGAHYQHPEAASPFLGNLAFYVGAARAGLGDVGAALAAFGTVLALRDFRRWAPALVLVLVNVGVMSTAEMRFERFLVPVLGVLALLAGLGAVSVQRRSALAAAALTLAAAFPSLQTSRTEVLRLTTPSASDRTLDWIDSHVPAGARFLDAYQRGLGLDRRRYEVIEVDPASQDLAQALALNVDFVITGKGDAYWWGRRLRTVFETRWGGLQLRAAPPELRTADDPVPLDTVRLSASQRAETLALLHDGRLDTAWKTAGPQKPGDWIRVDFPEPVSIGRIDLLLQTPEGLGAEVHVEVTEDGRLWRRVQFAEARPPVEEQLRLFRPAAQELVLAPEPVRGLRISQVGEAPHPWAIAELRIQRQAALRPGRGRRGPSEDGGGP